MTAEKFSYGMINRFYELLVHFKNSRMLGMPTLNFILIDMLYVKQN